MKLLTVRFSHIVTMLLLLVSCALLQQPVAASPFGQGVFGANVPFGSVTSMSITLGSNVSLSLTPNGSTYTGSGSHTVTVTTTDVIGYRLYVFSPSSTDMTLVNGSSVISASSNGTPAALAINTWGYNTNGTSNYIGMLTTPSVIKDANGPFKTGDNTSITYGAYADVTKPAGNYTISVVYTAVAKNP